MERIATGQPAHDADTSVPVDGLLGEHGQCTDNLSKREREPIAGSLLTCVFSMSSLVAGGGFEPPTFGL